MKLQLTLFLLTLKPVKILSNSRQLFHVITIFTENFTTTLEIALFYKYASQKKFTMNVSSVHITVFSTATTESRNSFQIFRAYCTFLGTLKKHRRLYQKVFLVSASKVSKTQPFKVSAATCCFQSKFACDMLQIDIMGQVKLPTDQNFKFALTGVDIFSRYLFAIALTSADTIAKAHVPLFM